MIGLRMATFRSIRFFSTSSTWTSPRFPSVQLPASISPAEIAYIELATRTAQSDFHAIVPLWQSLSRKNHLAGKEAIMQVALFAGFPRVINALSFITSSALAEHFQADSSEESSSAYANSSTIKTTEEWRQLGDMTFAAINGNVADVVKNRLHYMDRDLEDWIVSFSYGRVLSRPILSLRQRQLINIQLLTASAVLPQLKSHLIGAVRVGCTHRELRASIEIAPFLHADSARVEELETVYDQIPWAKLGFPTPTSPRQSEG